MKRAKSKHNSESGFTLIEVIATVLVIGILGAFFIHFMGTALNKSWRSVELVAGEAENEGTLESIIADYVKAINNDPDNALSALVSKKNNGDYGSNVTMAYIEFDTSGNEFPDASEPYINLKVTVEGPGHNLTTILTKSRTDSNDPPVYW